MNGNVGFAFGRAKVDDIFPVSAWFFLGEVGPVFEKLWPICIKSGGHSRKRGIVKKEMEKFIIYDVSWLKGILIASARFVESAKVNNR